MHLSKVTSESQSWATHPLRSPNSVHRSLCTCLHRSGSSIYQPPALSRPCCIPGTPSRPVNTGSSKIAKGMSESLTQPLLTHPEGRELPPSRAASSIMRRLCLGEGPPSSRGEIYDSSHGPGSLPGSPLLHDRLGYFTMVPGICKAAQPPLIASIFMYMGPWPQL